GIEILDAAGGVLLPGLKDHHLHLAATAVAKNSMTCGPNDWPNAQAFAEGLQRYAENHGQEWIRGIGYHESLAGEIDAAWLDKYLPDTPVRIQHRGGRQWIFNTAGLRWLEVGEGDPFERKNGELTGRLIEGDSWLRNRMQQLGRGGFPDLSKLSLELASYGITGVTDTSPDNNQQSLRHFEQARETGELLQTLLLMGDASLNKQQPKVAGVHIGARKFHLLESALPDWDQLVQAIASSHSVGRNVAFHCVTRTELVFALSALEQSGVLAGDRIEHASITPPEALTKIQELGLTVVAQPALIAERGDQYLADVDTDDQPWLYRLNAFLRADVPLAGSSDAPYTSLNPWQAMQAAVGRTTTGGATIGKQEALTPEQALALYTSPLRKPGFHRHGLQVGESADCCLLRQGWAELRTDLAQAEVELCIGEGRVLYGQ
ncbi:MAG: amidohydrolase family protein, partial [Salinisphaeraceae bacterium]|nr:amidohydrolase family protein [Salinisphaeraceae bacterium]